MPRMEVQPPGQSGEAANSDQPSEEDGHSGQLQGEAVKAPVRRLESNARNTADGLSRVTDVLGTAIRVRHLPKNDYPVVLLKKTHLLQSNPDLSSFLYDIPPPHPIMPCTYHFHIYLLFPTFLIENTFLID